MSGQLADHRLLAIFMHDTSNVHLINRHEAQERERSLVPGRMCDFNIDGSVYARIRSVMVAKLPKSGSRYVQGIIARYCYWSLSGSGGNTGPTNELRGSTRLAHRGQTSRML